MWLLAESPDRLDRLHIWLDHEQGLALWLTSVATVGLVVGILVAWFALRDARRTRHAELMMALSKRWEEHSVTGSLRLIGVYGHDGLLNLLNEIAEPPPEQSVAKRQEQLDAWDSLTTWLDLAETIAVIYVDRGISGRVLFNMWGASIAYGWDVWEDTVYRERQRTSLRGAYHNFELLSREMIDRLSLEKKSWFRRLPLIAGTYLRWRKLVRAIRH